MDMYLYPSICVCLSVYLSREIYSLVLSSSFKDNQEHTYRKKEETKKLGSFCLLLQGSIHTREHVEHLWESWVILRRCLERRWCSGLEVVKEGVISAVSVIWVQESGGQIRHGASALRAASTQRRSGIKLLQLCGDPAEKHHVLALIHDALEDGLCSVRSITGWFPQTYFPFSLGGYSMCVCVIPNNNRCHL